MQVLRRHPAGARDAAIHGRQLQTQGIGNSKPDKQAQHGLISPLGHGLINADPFRGVVLLPSGRRCVVGHDALASLPPNSLPVNKITKLTVAAIYESMA